MTRVLKRLTDRLRGSGGSRSEYHLLKMSHAGGWRSTGDVWEDRSDAPLDEPMQEQQLRHLHDPGRFRLVERCDGKIRRTVWRVETKNAEAYYAEQRVNEAVESDTDSDGETDSSEFDELERELIQQLREQEGPKAALEGIKEIKYD